jgi:hypothetical protein
MAKQQSAADAPDIIDVTGRLATTNEDERFIEDAGIAVRSFLAGLGEFFRTASAMERRAADRLTFARSLSTPKTADEDVTLQTLIRETTADSKAAIEHWNICQAVSGFHRRLTSARARTVDTLTEANTIQNRLHNAFTDAERRKAAEETERKRVEAERQAQADRDAEVARQEAAAAKAEAEAPDLSEREAVFVDLIVAGNKPSLAAQRAGFKNFSTVGPQLLERPKIAQAIEAKERAAAMRAQAQAVKQQPLDVQHEATKPDIKKASGASDRTTHGAEVVDEAALHDAVFAGRFGIPRDVLVVDPAKVNRYGKDLKELINKWPGVRYTKNTKVV